MDYPYTLTGTATPCETIVPSDGIINNYTGLLNSTCSYCAASCSAPPVDAKIGFLDGFNGKLVGFCYVGFISFTVIY